jgi:hypothetical protein
MVYAGEAWSDFFFASCDTTGPKLDGWKGNIKVKVGNQTATNAIDAYCCAYYSNQLLIFSSKKDEEQIYALAFDGNQWTDGLVAPNPGRGNMVPIAAQAVGRKLFVMAGNSNGDGLLFACDGAPLNPASWSLVAQLANWGTNGVQLTTDGSHLTAVHTNGATQDYFYFDINASNVNSIQNTLQWGLIEIAAGSPPAASASPVWFGGQLMIVYNSTQGNDVYSATGKFQKINGNQMNYLLSASTPFTFGKETAKTIRPPTAVVNNNFLCVAHRGQSVNQPSFAGTIWFGWKGP